MTTSNIKKEIPFWQIPLALLMEQLASGPNGISSSEAALRLAQFGHNLIHSEKKTHFLFNF